MIVVVVVVWKLDMQKNKSMRWKFDMGLIKEREYLEYCTKRQQDYKKAELKELKRLKEKYE